ncbi:MAG: pitrilysin family protein [Candidatus Sumerlaeia bacterium]|nr:pitrilysin family protein [Candidatus Sumerlaeia bacterium]
MKNRIPAKFLISAACAALAAATLSGCAHLGGASIPDRPEKLEFPALVFDAPTAEVTQLSNGIKVYLLADDSLPVFNARILFPNGDNLEPASVTGVGGVLSSAWRNGGSRNWPEEKLNDELEYLAASVETGVGGESTTISVSSLSRDASKVLAIASDLARNPLLPQEKIDLAKSQSLEGIRRRADSPAGLARRGFRQALYGKDSFLAAESSVESINAIDRAAVVDLHARIVGPKDTLIAAWGDFDREVLLRDLEAAFGSLPTARQRVFAYPEPPAPPKPGVYLVAKDTTQTQVRMGHLGLPMHDPDFFNAQVYNEIFGTGGFGSRLMGDIRSTRGLTYGISGALTMSQYNGSYTIGSSTRNATVRELHDAVLTQVERMRTEPVTPEELQQAKRAIANSYIFSFDSAGEIVNRQMLNDRDGYPADWLERYLPAIEAVTAEDIQRLARERTNPEDLVVLLVGPEADIKSQFEDVEITRIELGE